MFLHRSQLAAAATFVLTLMLALPATSHATLTASVTGGNTLVVQGDGANDLIDITHPVVGTIRISAHPYQVANSAPTIEASATTACITTGSDELECDWDSNSIISMQMNAGAGLDYITGGSPAIGLSTTLDGGEDSDHFYANTNSTGPDTYHDTGIGDTDWLSFADVTEGVKVIVWDGTNNDGRGCFVGPCEGDTVWPTGIETYKGSEYGDDFNGSAGAETFYGQGGDDTLNGQSGADVIYGGTGADTFVGDTDNDTLYTRDDVADTSIDCGGGAGDSAQTDDVDPATTGCESEDKESTAPVNTVAPAAPTGSATFLGTVTSTAGTWTGAGPITYTYQWLRCAGATCGGITGATGLSYQIQSSEIGMTLKLRVSATGPGGGPVTATSSATAVVPTPAAPSAGSATISGLHRIGRTLTASAGFTGLGVQITYRWQRCESDGSGCVNLNTGGSHEVDEMDLGNRMKLIATGTNPGGSAQATKLRDGVVFREPAASCAGLDPALDPDGDALSNRIECQVVQLPGTTQWLDLPSLGANPLHKDIFIEIDKMTGATFDGAAVTDVEAAFDRAPVTNPNGVSGIRMHIDNGFFSSTYRGSTDVFGRLSRADSTVPFDAVLGSFDSQNKFQWAEVDAIKSTYFERVRGFAFHYTLVGNRYGTDETTSSGIARANDFSAANVGQDTLITLGAGCLSTTVLCSGTVLQQEGTLMHELGHTLGLGHGGRFDNGDPDYLNRKPNYPSIMSYNYQMSGVVKTDGTAVLDYSRYDTDSPGGTVPAVDENALVETSGLGATGAMTGFVGMYSCIEAGATSLSYKRFNYNGPVDWNCSGRASSNLPSGIDINRVEKAVEPEALTTLIPHTDWDRLIYTGGSIGEAGAGTGGGGADDNPPRLDAGDLVHMPATAPDNDVDGPAAVMIATAQAARGDSVKPKIKVRVPRQKRRHGSWLRPLKVTITATDNKQLDRIFVLVNKKPQIVVLGGSTKKKYVLKLKKGRYSIRIVALDWLGATAKASKRIRVR